MRERAGALNYHHLFYFWHIVREGSIRQASDKLGVSQPTISEQLAALEAALGESLFDRGGRSLELTDVGQIVYRYATDIFTLGNEMLKALEGSLPNRPQRLVVGITEGIPKMLAYRLLKPVLRGPGQMALVCYEDPLEKLVVDLVNHAVDVVLADSAAVGETSIPIQDHLLGQSGIAFFARHEMAVRLRPWFPECLGTVPMLLPTPNTSLRRALDGWFHEKGIRPEIAGEFQDAGLLARFGEQGLGVFPACFAVEEDMRTHHRTEVVGRVPEIRQPFYALSVERRVVNPGVIALMRSARDELFRRDATP